MYSEATGWDAAGAISQTIGGIIIAGQQKKASDSLLKSEAKTNAMLKETERMKFALEQKKLESGILGMNKSTSMWFIAGMSIIIATATTFYIIKKKRKR